MDPFMGLIVLGTSVWMAIDASRLGYDKRDIKGVAALGPAGWLFAGLLLWIVAFPLYLVKRNELKAAGERRRQWALAGHGYPPLPGQPYGQMPHHGYGQQHGAMPSQGYGQHHAAMPPQPHGPMPHQGYGQHHAPMPPQGYGQQHVPMPPQGYGQHHAAIPGQPHGPMPHYGQGPMPAQPHAGHTPAGMNAPPAPSPTFDVADEIVKLGRLRDSGILTDAEFQQKKAEILARM